jgi:hypothetical protein
MHFRGPVFDTKNLGIFDIFLTYFESIDPSRPFFRAIFVILTHLRGIFCVLNEILSKKQRKIVTISTKKGTLKGPQKMVFLIVHRLVMFFSLCRAGDGSTKPCVCQLPERDI